MPTILILGPCCSGKSSIAEYLVSNEGFQRVRIPSTSRKRKPRTSSSAILLPSARTNGSQEGRSLVLDTASEFLDHATLNWRDNFVCTDIRNRKDLDAFIKRPWVLVVGCEAGTYWRWQRYCQRAETSSDYIKLPLEEFVRLDDLDMFGGTEGKQREQAGNDTQQTPTRHKRASTQTLHIPTGHTAATLHIPAVSPPSPDLSSRGSTAQDPFLASGSTSNGFNPPAFPSTVSRDPLAPLLRMCNLHIQTSGFADLDALYSCLRNLDLTKEDRMRPGWDRYFMTLAGLASLRSNCMKRRVGAVLVSNKRVISTGYNGTPRGMTNCNEGGCARCNSTSISASANGQVTPVKSGVGLDECLCLHAEENALLEAGRDRASAGDGGVMYCNTCPCLRCAVKIVQSGVKEVVYSQSYSMDELSARIFREAGVSMRQIELADD